MKLEEIIVWLRQVEDMACKIYSEAAESEITSPPCCAFLKRLAEDEALHYHLMGSAVELIREQENTPVSELLVDVETRDRVETPLRSFQDQIKKKHLTERDVLLGIVQSETSEWNDIFLYVINVCQSFSITFQYMAATIQAHERRIESYFQGLPDDKGSGLDLRHLPEIWETKILVVDDDEAIRRMWERVLGRQAQVTTAENGDIALRATKRDYFNVIITDVDMPVMDGLAFFRRVVEEDDRLRRHFIICTGNVTEAVTSVTEQHGVPILEKPVTIQRMYDAVQQTLSNAL